jgi:hypothetical protein
MYEASINRFLKFIQHENESNYGKSTHGRHQSMWYSHCKHLHLSIIGKWTIMDKNPWTPLVIHSKHT